ncbi:hypothetical protein FBU30_000488 [Linnemannia zychae]|nr:hypothetical protein FBU30_000488 [Linnemannia zychae]
MYPLFANLEEINLRGNWYRQFGRKGIEYSNFAPWKTKRCAIDHIQISFLRNAPFLEDIFFRRPMVNWSRRGAYRKNHREKFLNHLLSMSNLKIIVVSAMWNRAGRVPATRYQILAPMGPDSLWTKTVDSEEMALKKGKEGENTCHEKKATIVEIVDHILSDN